MPLPLVLIPGLMCDARLFQHQLATLSRKMPVMVAVPQCGETIEEMSLAILESAPAQFALAGFGLGAQVALDMMRRDLGRVVKLALISADPLGEMPQAVEAREKRLLLIQTGRLRQALAEDYPAKSLPDPETRPRLFSLLEDMALGLGPEVYLRQSRALQIRRDQQKTLRRAKMPALILAGALDPLQPAKRQAFMAELMPTARVQIFEGAGHLLPIEKPQAVSQALELFLAGPLVLR